MPCSAGTAQTFRRNRLYGSSVFTEREHDRKRAHALKLQNAQTTQTHEKQTVDATCSVQPAGHAGIVRIQCDDIRVHTTTLTPTTALLSGLLRGRTHCNMQAMFKVQTTRPVNSK